MDIKTYHIVLAVSRAGATDGQIAVLHHHLRLIGQTWPGIRIMLIVHGFPDEEAPGYGVPDSITKRPWPVGVGVHVLAPPRIRQVDEWARDVVAASNGTDEVWCCPATVQMRENGNNRPGAIMRAGKTSLRPSMFKWVPCWVAVEEADPAKGVKQKSKQNAPRRKERRYA